MMMMVSPTSLPDQSDRQMEADDMNEPKIGIVSSMGCAPGEGSEASSY